MDVLVEKRPRATHQLGDIASSAHNRVETRTYIDGKGEIAARGARRTEKTKRYGNNSRRYELDEKAAGHKQ